MKISLLGHDLSDQIRYIDEKSFSYKEEIFRLNHISIVIFKIESNLAHHPRLVELDAELNQLDDVKYPSILDDFSDSNDQNMVHHLIYENDRVQQFVKDYKANDLKSLGSIMYQSYDSYKYFVGQTSQEQDFLIFLAKSLNIIGANICKHYLICLMEDDNIKDKSKELMNHYYKKYKKELMIV
jgi:galactokinase